MEAAGVDLPAVAEFPAAFDLPVPPNSSSLSLHLCLSEAVPTAVVTVEGCSPHRYIVRRVPPGNVDKFLPSRQPSRRARDGEVDHMLPQYQL